MFIAKFALIYILISSAIIYLSRYLGYFDKPDKRRIHKIPIINTGGLIIYFVFFKKYSIKFDPTNPLPPVTTIKSFII